MAVKLRMWAYLMVAMGLTCDLAAAATSVPNTFKKSEPAKAVEVNENFSSLASAIDSNSTADESTSTEITTLKAKLAEFDWLNDKTKYYPNHDYEPGFFVELPQVVSPWVAFLDRWGSDITSTTSATYQVEAISYYATNKWVWFGVGIEWEADVAALDFSRDDRGEKEHIYSIRLNHHDQFNYASITMSTDPALSEYVDDDIDTNWMRYASSKTTKNFLSSLYTFMEFSSGKTKYCPSFQFHLELDKSVIVTGTDCVYRE
jgi:hypothetical protein